MKKDIEPNCSICLVRMCNASEAGKVIPTDRGYKFVCFDCCEEVKHGYYVAVEKEKIKT